MTQRLSRILTDLGNIRRTINGLDASLRQIAHDLQNADPPVLGSTNLKAATKNLHSAHIHVVNTIQEVRQKHQETLESAALSRSLNRNQPATDTNRRETAAEHKPEPGGNG